MSHAFQVEKLIARNAQQRAEALGACADELLALTAGLDAALVVGPVDVSKLRLVAGIAGALALVTTEVAGLRKVVAAMLPEAARDELVRICDQT